MSRKNFPLKVYRHLKKVDNHWYKVAYEKMSVQCNGKAWQQKTEKFCINDEKKFGRIDSQINLNGRIEIENWKRFIPDHSLVSAGIPLYLTLKQGWSL